MSYDYSKTNKMLWDMKTTELYEFTYSLYIEEINKINHELHIDGIKTRVSYTPLSNFIILIEYNPDGFNGVLNKAVIELRKIKINKIKDKIYLK